MTSRVRAILWSVAVSGVLCAIACGSRADREERSAAPETSRAEAPLPPVAGRTEPRIVILGDSLTAGLGLPMSEAFPSRLQRLVSDAGLTYTIVNAGVSGDTSAGGVSRLDWALDGDVRILVVALGGNDGLRGLPVSELTSNLSQVIERAQARGIRVILAGMEAPPNYGQKYAFDFHKIYPALAKKYHVPLVPFLLERVAGITDLNQADGIHPTAEGAGIVADNVWTVLEPVLQADVRDAGHQAKGPGR